MKLFLLLLAMVSIFGAVISMANNNSDLTILFLCVTVISHSAVLLMDLKTKN